MKAAANSKKAEAPQVENTTAALEGSELGEVKVHENVIASLVRRAALSVEGVSRLAGSTLVDNIAEIVEQFDLLNIGGFHRKRDSERQQELPAARRIRGQNQHRASLRYRSAGPGPGSQERPEPRRPALPPGNQSVSAS